MAAIVIAALYFVIDLGVQLERSQWDFKAYYYAAKISADGMSPYNLDAARSAAGGYVHPFLYPPLTVYLFRPLTMLPYGVAVSIWFWLRVVLLVPLFWMWRKYFVPEGPSWQLYVLIIAAFGGAVYLDLHAGNITIVEQVLLWLGFVFLVRGRAIWFCTCIVAVSLIKFLPIVFLGMLFLLPVRHKWRYGIGSIAAFGLVQLIDFMVHPSLYRQFISGVLGWDERGSENNPALLSMLKELRDFVVGQGFPDVLGSVALFALYGAIAFAVGIITWRLLKRSISDSPDSAEQTSHTVTTILLYTLGYAVVAPRFKNYSFILVLPVAYWVIRRYVSQAAIWIAIVLIVLTAHPSLPLKKELLEVFWWYYPMLTLVILWIVWVVGANRESRISTERTMG
jgi:hypothetical protein